MSDIGPSAAEVMRQLQRAAIRDERDAALEENRRLRELYENVVGNRERFGWTINHLLECEDALTESAATHFEAGVAEGRAAGRDEALREVVAWLRKEDTRQIKRWRGQLINAAAAIEAAFPTTGETDV